MGKMSFIQACIGALITLAIVAAALGAVILVDKFTRTKDGFPKQP